MGPGRARCPRLCGIQREVAGNTIESMTTFFQWGLEAIARDSRLGRHRKRLIFAPTAQNSATHVGLQLPRQFRFDLQRQICPLGLMIRANDNDSRHRPCLPLGTGGILRVRMQKSR